MNGNGRGSSPAQDGSHEGSWACIGAINVAQADLHGLANQTAARVQGECPEAFDLLPSQARGHEGVDFFWIAQGWSRGAASVHEAAVTFAEIPLHRLEEGARILAEAMEEAPRALGLESPALTTDINMSAPQCWNKDGHHDSVERLIADPAYRING